MTYTPTKTLTFEEFLLQYETVSSKLATQIGIAITTAQHPWFIPRNCLIRPFIDTTSAHRPDIIVLDETQIVNEPYWEKNPLLH